MKLWSTPVPSRLARPDPVLAGGRPVDVGAVDRDRDRSDRAADAGDEVVVDAGAIEVGAPDRVGVRAFVEVGPADVGAVDRHVGGTTDPVDEALVDARPIEVGATDRVGDRERIRPVDVRGVDRDSLMALVPVMKLWSAPEPSTLARPILLILKFAQ